MKQALAAVLVLTLAAPTARADDTQDHWRAAFAGSVMVTATGVTLMLWGRNRIDTAEHALCTGDYETNCGHPPPTTAAIVDDYNEKGDRGQTIGRLGLGLTVAGLVLTGFTAYKGFGSSNHESKVAVTPSIGPRSAGAALTLRW